MSVGELTNPRSADSVPVITGNPIAVGTAPADRYGRGRSVLSNLAVTVCAVLAVGALWELAKAVFGVSDLTLPHTWSVLAAFGDTLPNGDNRAASLIENIAITLQEAVIGLLLGIVIGVVFGVISAKSRFASYTLTPVLVATQTFPLVAIVPALVIILGEGWFSLSLIASILAFFPIYVAVARAISDTGVDQRQLFRSFGFSSARVFVTLEMPRATLAVVAIIRTATALAVTGAIVAELPSGSSSGISMTLLSAASYYLTDPEALWCAALVAMIGGVVLVYVMSAVASFAARFILRIPAEPKDLR